MSEDKNIDKLFKEQFKDFEVAPNDAIWKHIEAELDKDKRKRRVIPIWWTYGGVAAALLILIAIANSFVNTASNGSESKIVDTEKTIEQPVEKDTILNNLKSNNFTKAEQESVAQTKIKEAQHSAVQNRNVTTLATTNSNLSAVDNTSTNEHHSKESNSSKATVSHRSVHQNAVTYSNGNSRKERVIMTPKGDSTVQNEFDNQLHQATNAVTSVHTADRDNMKIGIDSVKTTTQEPLENAIEQAIANSKNKEDNTVKDSIQPNKRWSLAPNVAPVYFNSLGNGSSIDDQFVDNSKEGDINMSYGIKGAYAISNKFTIRAGINKVNLGYSTNDIMVFSESNTSTFSRTLQHVDTKDNASTYLSMNNIRFSDVPEILSSKEQSSINQELGFIEVPIEIAYSVIDSRIGVHLIGGFSTLFLSDNDVYSVVNSGSRTRLGEASNINNMSYSANLGIGVNYNFSTQLRFNLEPTFKYQINTFNDTSGNFQPFFIGVYTGLSFKF